MQSLYEALPSADGLLPKWLLFISIVSVANSVQAYTSLSPTQRVYSGSSASLLSNAPALPAGIPAKTAKPSSVASSPVTPLSARTFGTWTLISSIVRLYAAYNITDKAIYEIAMWTFGIAGAHFCAEWLWYRTARLNAGLLGPLIVSSMSMAWMWMQKGYYVQ